MTANTRRVLIHIPHGLGFAITALSDQPAYAPVFALGWLGLVIAYQFCEDTHDGGCSWPDIQGYMIGAGLPAGAWALWRLLTS